ncbi:MAG: hypothetical protein QOD72_2836 [Acidimicrobiaceae bacterium]|nr:hypothetical protein [Acidimicrobiaceae bacterium]
MRNKYARKSLRGGKLHRFVAVLAGACLVSGGAIAASMTNASADTQGPITFESGYTNGSVNGQDGWSSTGGYDQAIVDNSTIPAAPASFGTKSFRISDAVTSGSFGDQTFTKSTNDAAGEPGADAGVFSTGTLRNNFSASFNFASTTPAVEQPGLHISISPDRGDGARMSYVRVEDSASGWNLFFDDVQDAPPYGSGGNLDDGCDAPGGNFVETQIASGLSRSPHNLKFVMKFVPGGNNDVVHVLLDGNVVASGTSWENYYRYCSESGGGTGGPLADQTRIVRNLELREGGDPDLANSGQGFLFDGVKLTTADNCTATCYVNGTTGDDAATGQSGDPLKTIQAGVDQVNAGGTVNVAAGTYDANTTIPKAVVLNGANVGIAGTGTRGAESLVKLTSGEAGSIFNITTANQVTINGFRAQFQGSEQNGGLLLSLAASNHLTFKNNLVDSSTYVNTLIFDDSAATSTVTNNKFTGLGQTGSPGTGVLATWGSVGGTQDAVTITGNTFSQLTDQDGVPAINLNTVTGVVSGNTFSDIHQYGILLADKLGPLAITGNTFTNIHNDTPNTSSNRGSGIRTFSVPDFVGPVTITTNTFSNSYHGVRVANDGSPADISGGDMVVNRNSITGMTAAGVSLATGTTGTLDGTCNWWGSTAGPSGTSTDGSVTTTPFLRSPTLSAQCPATVPGTPTAVFAVPFNDHGAKVGWTPPANTGGSAITGYRITPYKAGVAQPAVVFNSTATNQLITGLQDTVSYTFKVAARNAVGFGVPSAQSAAMIAGAPGQPGVPTVVRIASGQLRNTFAAPMNNGAAISSYSVTCTSSNGGVTKTNTGAASPITVTGLSAAKTYTCRVSATNSRGTGPLSKPSAAINA